MGIADSWWSVGAIDVAADALWLIGRNALGIISGLETGEARDAPNCDGCWVLLHCSMALRVSFLDSIERSNEKKNKIKNLLNSFFSVAIDFIDRLTSANLNRIV